MKVRVRDPSSAPIALVLPILTRGGPTITSILLLLRANNLLTNTSTFQNPTTNYPVILNLIINNPILTILIEALQPSRTSILGLSANRTSTQIQWPTTKIQNSTVHLLMYPHHPHLQRNPIATIHRSLLSPSQITLLIPPNLYRPPTPEPTGPHPHPRPHPVPRPHPHPHPPPLTWLRSHATLPLT